LETISEFGHRIRTDLEGSKADIVRHDLASPSLFAFPFSAEVTPTNDRRAPALVSDVVAREFDVAMTNSEPATFASQRDRQRRVLPRVEVFARTTPHELFDRIASAAPISPRRIEPLRTPTLWVDSAGRSFDRAALRGSTTPLSSSASSVHFDRGAARLAPDAGAWLGAFFAPGRLADWSAYTASVTMSELSAGGTGGLLVHVGAPSSTLSVSVSDGFVSVHRSTATDKDQQLAAVRVTRGDSHRVVVAVGHGTLTVRVDGRTIVASIPHPSASSGSVGISANTPSSGGRGVVFRDLVVDARPRR
jgi:hypothetical protein